MAHDVLNLITQSGVFLEKLILPCQLVTFCQSVDHAIERLAKFADFILKIDGHVLIIPALGNFPAFLFTAGGPVDDLTVVAPARLNRQWPVMI